MKCRMLLPSLLTIVIALPAGAALADAVPPPDWKPDGMQAVSLPARPVTKLAIGRFAVNLDKTTLQQVRDALGAGKIEQQDNLHWLCYTVRTGAAPERLWLIADGAAGGPEHRVTMVHALHMAALLPSPRCPLLPRSFLPLRFDKDLWLRQPALKVERAFGQPSINAHDRWSYSYTGKSPVPGKDGAQPLEVRNRVEARIRDGLVEAIIASQTRGE